MPSREKRSRLTFHPRDVSYMKPKKFQSYLTVNEVALAVGKDASWIDRLEKADRIPKARRVKVGKLQVRLWSPEQVDEIKEVLSKMKPGRKPKT